MKSTRIETNEITDEQKATVILEYGKSFDDVEFYTKRRRHGVDRISAHYVYNSSENKFLDGLQIIYGNKRSAEYQNAKKRLNVTNNQVNKLRKAVK